MKNIIESYLENNNVELKTLLETIFSKDIKNITFLGKCKLQKMPEYEFYLLKYNVVLEDFSNYTIFIRLTDENKIQENLFCYWYFCEEYYYLNNKHYISKANIINLDRINCKVQYSMEIFNKNNILWKKSIINIIDLDKFFYKRDIEKNEEDTHMIKLLKTITKSLFIAII